MPIVSTVPALSSPPTNCFGLYQYLAQRVPGYDPSEYLREINAAYIHVWEQVSNLKNNYFTNKVLVQVSATGAGNRDYDLLYNSDGNLTTAVSSRLYQVTRIRVQPPSGGLFQMCSMLTFQDADFVALEANPQSQSTQTGPYYFLLYGHGRLRSAIPMAAGTTLEITYTYWPLSLTFMSSNNPSSSIASATATSLAADNFNRANVNPLNTNWATTPTFTPAQIVGNAVEATVLNTSCVMQFKTLAFPPNQISSITVTNLVGSSLLGPAVRLGAGSGSGYVFNISGAVGGPGTGILSVLGGALLSSIPIPLITVGDTFSISANGTTISASQNGVILTTVVDSTTATGQPGFFILANAALTNVVLDNWIGSAITGTTGVVGTGTAFTQIVPPDFQSTIPTSTVNEEFIQAELICNGQVAAGGQVYRVASISGDTVLSTLNPVIPALAPGSQYVLATVPEIPREHIRVIASIALAKMYSVAGDDQRVQEWTAIAANNIQQMKDSLIERQSNNPPKKQRFQYGVGRRNRAFLR